MMPIRALIGGTGVILVLLAVLALKTSEETRLRRQMNAQAACLAAIAGSDADAPARACPAGSAVIARDATARRADRCDRALQARDGFAVEASCSAPLKVQVAEALAAQDRADSLQAALAQTRAQQAQAIVRAEARARSQSERSNRAAQATEQAPRDADGLVVCDADCLRQRFAPD